MSRFLESCHLMSIACNVSLTSSLQAKNILIATGSFASKIPIEGSEYGITSDEVLNLEKLPGK